MMLPNQGAGYLCPTCGDAELTRLRDALAAAEIVERSAKINEKHWRREAEDWRMAAQLAGDAVQAARAWSAQLWQCLREMRKQRNQWVCNAESLQHLFVSIDAAVSQAVALENARRRRMRRSEAVHVDRIVINEGISESELNFFRMLKKAKKVQGESR
jgi:hypothetical protein